VIGHDDRAGKLAADVDLDLLGLPQIAVEQRQPDRTHALLVGLGGIDAGPGAHPVRDHRPAGNEAGRFAAAQHPGSGPGDALVD